MRIRLTGTREETQQAAAVLAEVFDLREVSDFYPNRSASRLGRIYLDATPNPARRRQLDPALLEDRRTPAMTHTTPKRSHLAERATEIVKNLSAHGFTTDNLNRQVLNLAEEVGEFVGAYRRWSGQARRTGTAQEMHGELADVVISAYTTAARLGVDLDAAVAAKLQVIFSRGWRDTPPAQRHNDPGPFCAATIPPPDGDFACGEDALPGSDYCRLHQHPDLP